jgi:hypothetical protein
MNDYKPRIYPNPTIINNCISCESCNTDGHDKNEFKCELYHKIIEEKIIFDIRFPEFCKLDGVNLIDNARIYPYPSTVYCCINCPACRREGEEPPFKCKCIRYDQYIDLEDALRNNKFPEFCKLKERV